MKITVQDDGGRTETVSHMELVVPSSKPLLPDGVQRRVITIERPAEKTNGEKLHECFQYANGSNTVSWCDLMNDTRRDYENAAKLFIESHLSTRKDWMDPSRDWEERRTFVGRYVGDMLQSSSLECHRLSSLLGWGTRPGLHETIPLLRVTVDRLKET